MLLTPIGVIFAQDNPYQSQIHYYAVKYGVNEDHLTKTIQLESNFDPNVQSNFLNKDGSQERSYGLAQINLDYHPDITIEEAKDPDFAINFIAKEFADGHAYWWSAWRILYGNKQLAEK